MTAAEAYNFSTQGGADVFRRMVDVCRRSGPFCLIGGLAVNAYVEPVYTLDADFVVASGALDALRRELDDAGYPYEEHPHSLNITIPGSQLRVQLTTDERYASFPDRAVERDIFDVKVPVAGVEDIVRGKAWAFGDPARRLSKRKKDELDLIRLAEAYPETHRLMPPEILRAISGEYP